MLEQRHEDKWCPVVYASRSLNPSEKNYSPIELETLAVVFACNKFNQYVYGRHFIVQSDHQPLKTIMKKDLAKTPPRLQRLLLNLQKFDFEVEYVTGKENIVSDMFSRAPLKYSNSELSKEEIESQIHMVISSLPISEQKLHMFITETERDETLQTVITQIQKGWPKYRSEVSGEIKAYFAHKDNLAYHNGLVSRGSQIVVPVSMRKELLKTLHHGHQGIEKI